MVAPLRSRCPREASHESQGSLRSRARARNGDASLERDTPRSGERISTLYQRSRRLAASIGNAMDEWILCRNSLVHIPVDRRQAMAHCLGAMDDRTRAQQVAQNHPRSGIHDIQQLRSWIPRNWQQALPRRRARSEPLPDDAIQSKRWSDKVLGYRLGDRHATRVEVHCDRGQPDEPGDAPLGIASRWRLELAIDRGAPRADVRA